MTIESLEGMTVLLVDDESFSRKLVARMLSDMGRPAVIEAEDGERALAILAEHQVDLIVSDFNMPKVHGLQLLRSVRAGQTQSRRDMPFAMLTGYSERKLVDMALALGINAFLIKPVSSDGLKRRLTLMLSHDQEDGWLKDEDTYQAVDVDGTLDEIVKSDTIGDSDIVLDLNSIEQALVRPQGRAYGSGPKPVRSGSAKQSSWGRFSSKDLNEDALLTSGEVEARGDATRRKPKPGKVEVRGEGGAATHAKVPEHACPLDELRDNAVLAREIRTADGSLFMHTGTHLTPPIISILKDLNQLGHPVSSIWIEGQP